MTKKNYPTFAYLHPYSKWTLRARVSRKMEVHKFSGARKMLKLLLVDEKGSQMEALMWNKNVDRFESSIEEGKVYCLSNVEVQHANQSYKIVESEYQCILTEHTKIEEEIGECSELPLAVYDFIDFNKVSNSANKVNKVKDAIGMIVHVGKIQMVNFPNQKNVPTRDVFLANAQSCTMKLTLWCDLAVKDGEMLLSLVGKNAIVVVTSLTVRNYNGYYMSSTKSTKVLVNPNLKEAEEIKSWFLEDNAEGKELFRPDFSAFDLLDNAKRISVEGILKNIDLPNYQVGHFRLVATISRIFSRNEFWYISCVKCYKKLKADDYGYYRCVKCQIENAHAVLRYVVHLEVMDHTGSLKLTLFDKAAENLFRCNVTDLKLLKSQENGDELLNDLITKCTWERYNFFIKFTKKQDATGESLNLNAIDIKRLDAGTECRELLARIQAFS